MCGISGFFLSTPAPGDSQVLSRSLKLMHHRGPDSRGLVLVGENGITRVDEADIESGQFSFAEKPKIAMGHVRFSLVDLTRAGYQPFFTDDNKVCVTFNGQIYNYVEVRRDLEQQGFSFQTNSDTEVLAKAYQCWGTDCFERFNGFWALALYDVEKKRLLLSRDRLGKAPLYVCRNERGLFWASELKSLMQFVPEEAAKTNASSVLHFANWLKKDFGHSTFYENIRTFPNASYCWVDPSKNLDTQGFWQLPTQRRTEQQLSIPDAVAEHKSVMQEAVRIRVRADAPVSVQLSGGMDSSTLVALAAGLDTQVEAFTVKYGYGDQDEEPYARAVAESFGDKVKYNVIRFEESDFVDQLEQFSRQMDEPYHSPNQLSSQFVWREMAQKGFRAVLYGGGGDEVFAGYVSEYYAPYLNSLLRQGKMGTFARNFWSCSEYSSGLLPKDQARMLARMMPMTPRRTTHGKVRFIPKEMNPLHPDLVATTTDSPPHGFDERLHANMASWRMNYWLRNDNQNSLSVPMELRSPMLDYKVMEHAFTLPPGYLIRDGWLKWIMRKAMEDTLPASIVWRRNKMGFPFPLGDWLAKNEKSLLEMCACDCPYVSWDKLRQNYGALCKVDVEYVWGMIAILLWWKQCVAESARISA